MQAMNQAM